MSSSGRCSLRQGFAEGLRAQAHVASRLFPVSLGSEASSASDRIAFMRDVLLRTRGVFWHQQRHPRCTQVWKERAERTGRHRTVRTQAAAGAPERGARGQCGRKHRVRDRQKGAETHRDSVRVGPLLEEEDGDVVARVTAGVVEGGEPVLLVAGVDGRSAGEEDSDNLAVPPLSRQVEGGHPFLRFRFIHQFYCT